MLALTVKNQRYYTGDSECNSEYLMNIILEGSDASGKTILAKFLSERLKMPVRHSGGPSKYPGEILERAKRYLSDSGSYIYDRHPCVSQNIYVTAFGLGETVPEKVTRLLYASGSIIIFCRGGDFQNHVPSEHASEDHNFKVKQHHSKICDLYDEWALRHAHICYRIGDDMERIADLCSTFDPVRDIERFHKKFGLEYAGSPRFLDGKLFDFRFGFMDEELNEYLDHNLLIAGDPVVRLSNALDSLVDLVYVALGTSYLHGFNFREAWRRVQEANMKKVRAEKAEDSKRGSTFDVVKPPGWLPPDHTDLVRNYEIDNRTADVA